MCRVAYIGADFPLPTVPFDEDAPAFCVEPLGALDTPLARIRELVPTQHLYKLGSSSRCACEFGTGGALDASWPDDPRRLSDVEMANRRALAEYVAGARQKGPLCLLFFWVEHENEPVRTLTTDDPHWLANQELELVDAPTCIRVS